MPAEAVALDAEVLAEHHVQVVQDVQTAHHVTVLAVMDVIAALVGVVETVVVDVMDVQEAVVVLVQAVLLHVHLVVKHHVMPAQVALVAALLDVQIVVAVHAQLHAIQAAPVNYLEQ